MSLIIHKQPGAVIPLDLLATAHARSPAGWSLMGIAPDGQALLERHLRGTLDELLLTEQRLRAAEYVLLLRGSSRNAGRDHTLDIGNGFYAMHDGTLQTAPGAEGLSDYWQFISGVLRPLSPRRGLLLDRSFQRLLELALKPGSKVALMDAGSGAIVVLNRRRGVERADGIWLSSDPQALEAPVRTTPPPVRRLQVISAWAH